MIAAGLALAACGPARVGPAPSNAKVKLVWQPWRVGWGQGWEQVFYEQTQSFRDAHPGIDIVIDIAGQSSSNDGYVVTQILAGNAPDVFSGYGPEKMMDGGYVLDLTAALRKANFDTSTFVAGQLAVYSRDGGLFAVPAELSTTALAVNKTMLDDAGLDYPEAGWTVTEATDMWQQLTKRGGKTPVVGATFWSEGGNCPGNYYWRGFGANIVDPSNAALCAADSTAGIALGNWFYPRMQQGVFGFSGDLLKGTAATVTMGSWTLPTAAAQWTSLDYDFYPYPTWATGDAAYAGRDYYAITANTKYPDEAAEFLIWLVQPDWQRSMMRLQFVVPSIRSLWDEWKTTVQAVAPPLAAKNLGAFTEAAFKDRCFPKTPFAAFADAAYSTFFNFTNQISTQELSVATGLKQGTDAVNAFEKVAAQMVVAAQKTQSILDQSSGSAYPAPSATGFGVPSAPASKDLINGTNGVYTLIGDGGDVWGTSDNCTFAGAAQTSPTGSYICRVTALANVDCPKLSTWCKIGLMARGDLSDDAPMVLVCASSANGVFVDVRPSGGSGASQQQAGNPPPKTGLIAAKYLTKPLTTKTDNYLLAPVWLKLDRNGSQWQASSSPDGNTWTKAGDPVEAQMAGCYVGLFCTSHNSDIGGKGTIKCTVDKVSGFDPKVFVQLGTP